MDFSDDRDRDHERWRHVSRLDRHEAENSAGMKGALTMIFGGAALLGSILLFAFGLSAKSGAPYQCGLEVAAGHDEVVSSIGGPLRPGLFAWQSSATAPDGRSQGIVETSVSGPRGTGSLEIVTTVAASASESPELRLLFHHGGSPRVLHDGRWPCMR